MQLFIFAVSNSGESFLLPKINYISPKLLAIPLFVTGTLIHQDGKMNNYMAEIHVLIKSLASNLTFEFCFGLKVYFTASSGRNHSLVNHSLLQNKSFT